VLEVGVGPGQMFRVLARDPCIERLTGIDIPWNEEFIRPPRGEFELINITKMRFSDGEFDTVLCMEVLEHLELTDSPSALAELRRVCARRLIVTVAFEEPEPVWHHDKPGGYRQSFSRRLIDVQFPNAKRRLLARGTGKWPWIMLQETRAPGRK
jgi:ubiquinone/menaquinone biosynthesis C-methylase UbiE